MTEQVATLVLLLRHAQSTWNADGRWQGQADPPLSAGGRAAAAAAAADPEFDEISGVVASDLARARETAEIIALARGWPAPTTYRGLRERGAGDWTGLTRADIDAGWPGALDATPPLIPGGEDSGALVARAIATLHRVAEAWPDASVLAVSHGALIRAVEQHGGVEPSPVPNLSGRWVEVAGGRLTIRDRLPPPVVERAG